MSAKTAIKSKSKGAPIREKTGKTKAVLYTRAASKRGYSESAREGGARVKEDSAVMRSARNGALKATSRTRRYDAPGLERSIPLEAQLSAGLVAEVEGAGPDVNTLCDSYGLKREELGRLTGFSLRALAEWASGKLPSQPAMRRLHEVRRLLDALAEIVKRESIPGWLHRSNPAFDKLTPLQVIELGEIDRLWAMVHDLGSGQPG